ncbi:MAG: Re/Si-specific NAD(P)(+) transhydrogenase subunit alpha [Aquisalinus sp.]|nr:Re/Si-specific NAD(P)(+) transhydrogenase subunit alpha [Aquisalinus sp.]
MKLAVLKETRAGEFRVAAVPDTVKKLVGLRYDVTVEKDAGFVSAFSNEDYEDAGAKIAATAEEAAKNADLILKVQRPDANELKLFANGAKLVGILSPYADEDSLSEYATAGVDAFAMEFMPRITRAQSMDVLSSQSNLAGYKAVIDAAAEYGRAMPMMMTAAGTIAPAKVFVMGAGVAGLQAIATAKRLGAVVSATDVRYAAKEQVESLGGTFVVVDEEAMKDAETEGGYAKEMSDDFKKRQAEFVAAHIAKQDIVITTALIPGRPAPELVSDGMVRAMKPGSVIVDLAVEQGGNVAPSKAGEIVHVDGVKVVGHNNVPGRLAADASSLYAKNILNFLTAFTDAETGNLNVDMEDEIINGILLTRDGQIIHPAFAKEAEPQAVVAEVVETVEDVKE